MSDEIKKEASFACINHADRYRIRLDLRDAANKSQKIEITAVFAEKLSKYWGPINNLISSLDEDVNS